jgi:hypothetical protein
MIAESATGPRLVPSWKDKRPGVVFFTVRATVAILSPYVEPKNRLQAAYLPRCSPQPHSGGGS